MALTKCPECGQQVSDRAKKCPHCGCPIEFQKEETSEPQNKQPQPPNPRKIHKRLLIILVVVGALAVITGSFLLFGNNSFGTPTLTITPEFTKALERYDQIDAFSEGMAAVHRDGKWGYVNLKGEEVIPCQFSDAFTPGQFSEGLACVVDDRNEADKELWNKRVGFINKKGEWVLEGDFFTEAHCPYASMQEYSDYLPSFKDGKVAIWDKSSTYDNWDEWDNTSKIILIDHKGKIHETTDSIGRNLIEYKPYTSSTSNEPKLIKVYEDYYLTEYRDTLQCDNEAKLVTWQILDMNNFPYQTNGKAIRYFIDNHGNSTLTSTQQEAMEQHLSSLKSNILDEHEEQLRRQAEEERIKREGRPFTITLSCDIEDHEISNVYSNMEIGGRGLGIAPITVPQGKVYIYNRYTITPEDGWRYTTLHIARNGYWNDIDLKTSGEISIYGGEKFYLNLITPWGYGRKKTHINATFYFTEKTEY